MAPIPATLRDATDPADLMDRLHQIAGDEVPIKSIRFFCGSSEADSIVVMIDAGEHSPFLARTLRGLMFGGVATCRIAPLHPEFHCASRRDGRLTVSSCDSCSSRDWPVRGEGGQPDRGLSSE